ncbi:MAG: carbohydrate ABC transporter permease [Anaerolineaceae bacterium]|nr:carbohydrate ABC transporter permease [Anaerolineaceae bacterium]
MIETTIKKQKKPSISHKTRRKIWSYLVLISIAIVIGVPFYWMLATALRSPDQILQLPPSWIPNPISFENFPKVFEEIPFARFIGNTFVLEFWNILGQLFATTLVAYGFSRFRFPGRDVLFLILLATLMIPNTITLVPQFVMFAKLGLTNSYLPLILPSFAGSPYLIFLMRQYMLTIPLEYDEAALLDGANRIQVLWHVILPLCVPALVLVTVFTFVDVWNDFLRPLVYINDPQKFTVSIGLAFFQGAKFTAWEMLMAGSLIAMLPPAILFFITQKRLMGGISMTGRKG